MSKRSTKHPSHYCKPAVSVWFVLKFISKYRVLKSWCCKLKCNSKSVKTSLAQACHPVSWWVAHISIFFFFFTMDCHWKCGVYNKHCGFLMEWYAKIHSTLNAAINFAKNFLMLIYLANQWWLVTAPDNTGSLLGKCVLIEARRWKPKFMSVVSPATKEQKMIKGTFQTIECYKI